jgi:hypothetical protein
MNARQDDYNLASNWGPIRAGDRVALLDEIAYARFISGNEDGAKRTWHHIRILSPYPEPRRKYPGQ